MKKKHNKKSKKYKKESFLAQYSPATQRRIKLLFSIFIAILVFAVFYISQAISNTVTTQKLVEQRKLELKQEEERKSVLQVDLKRLENPEYIRQYARGRYQYTANDEIIFILPKEDSNEVTTSENESQEQSETTTSTE